jgi:hypothetical protein
MNEVQSLVRSQYSCGVSHFIRLAAWVERTFPKLDVAGSIPVSRSNFFNAL